MSNTIVGNNANPTDCYTWYEVEVDDDQYEDMEGELVDEENIFARRAIIPKNSNSTTVTIFYYYLAPTSSWYWDYNYGDPYKPVIPVVFAADSNWQLTQCLNTSFAEPLLHGQSNGWKSFTITLTRKLVAGERIVYGLYSDLLGYTSTGEIEDSETTESFFYWTRARRRDYASQISYLTSPEFISQQRNIFNDYEICLYLEYENEPDSIAYTRTVLGNVGAVTVISRKTVWKRNINPVAAFLTGVSRKSAYKKSFTSNGDFTDAENRALLCARSASSNNRLSSFNNRKLINHRALENQSCLSSAVRRSAFLKISKQDEFSVSDFLKHLLLIIRHCFSAEEFSDISERKAVYHKILEITVNNEETVQRCGENFRSFEDEYSVVARPFASRLFFRAFESVMSLWDWLRGKIREANNVVTLFCPIATEIEMECRI